MIDIYAAESSVGKREIKTMMKDETWFTAKEAKERGFIDTIIESGQAARAQFDLSMFSHAPSDFKAQPEGGKVLTKRETEKALRDAGASIPFAKAIAAGCSSPEGEANKELLESLSNLFTKF